MGSRGRRSGRDRPPGRAAARLALLVAALIWGASFTIVQVALRDLGVFHLLALRFALATALLWPLARRGVTPEPRRGVLRDGAALLVGLALFAGFVLQTAGLRFTTPAKSAFITGLSVVLVPLLGWAAGGARPRWGPALGALCALAGLYALYSPLAGATVTLNLGDWLTLAGAISFAAHVLLVERHVHRVGVQRLALAQFAVVAVLAAPSLLAPPTAAELTPRALTAVAVTAVFATVLAFLCQLYAQRHLSATETVVWLTLEPLFAAAISIAAGAEAFGMPLVAGGALILFGMLLSQFGAAVPEPSLAEHGGDPHPPSDPS